MARSRAWKGKTRRKWPDEIECVASSGMIFGCFAVDKMRASRLTSCGGWHWDGVVSLMASVSGGAVWWVL